MRRGDESSQHHWHAAITLAGESSTAMQEQARATKNGALRGETMPIALAITERPRAQAARAQPTGHDRL